MLLNCHTYYSYKFGTLSIEQLIQEAIDKQYKTIVLTDINSTSASIEFVRICTEKQIKPILGIDFRNGAHQQYIGIAINNDGFYELNEHLTHHLHSGEQFTNAPEFKNAYVVYPMEVNTYRKLKNNEYVGVRPDQVGKIHLSAWHNYKDKLVVLQPVTFRGKRDFNIHRLLRAIDNNTLLSKLPKTEEALPNEIMLPESELIEHFHEYPAIVENTKHLTRNCFISFDFKTAKNKKSFTNSPEEDFELLKRECQKGLKYRFRNPSQIVLERVDKELHIIRQLNFCSYFLINWDLVNYARSQGCYYVGRGSGANSMVAYLLRITDVDPIELDLYFERFINPSRNSPPDFDIDFSSRDRNMITKYLFNKHGWDHTALVGTYITFQYKSMIRELGKVFGLPSDEIDRLQSTKYHRQNIDEIGRLVLKYSEFIHGFPSHLSVHSSGIIISEKPIGAYTATIMPPKGFPTVHFSMLEAEDIGFAKFDILGQRGISKIEDSIEIIKENTGDDVDIHDIQKFKNDEKVKQLLKQGKAIGCFYIESPAMRMLLRKLEAEDYIRLVAASSIIRPGVAKSGMMREYILRYRNQERRKAARKELPELYDLLAETYGVMVYQEDVIKVAHYFADLTLAESDVLRRGMSWKFKQRNEFSIVKDKFFSNCKKKKYPHHIVERVWAQIESFANYAFSKGHSASYAVESFQALYLKAYYPLEYMVATINNGGGFYHTELYVHEARMHGAFVVPPCVNHSDSISVIRGKTIYLGLGFVKSLETNTIRSIVLERLKNGCFKNLQDLLNRVPVSLEQLCILIRIGALRFTGKSKKELLWDAHFILGKSKKVKPEKTLFNQKVKEFKLPELYSPLLEDAYNELELIGFSVGTSPFKLIDNLPDIHLLARDLPSRINQNVEIIGYLIHIKGTKTSNEKYMSFGVFIDLEGHWIDTVQFPEVIARYPFRGPGCYRIKGKVVSEFGFISIEVSELYRLPNINLEEPSTRLKNTGTGG